MNSHTFHTPPRRHLKRDRTADIDQENTDPNIASTATIGQKLKTARTATPLDRSALSRKCKKTEPPEEKKPERKPCERPSLLAMRCTSGSTVSDAQEQKVELKTAVLLNADRLESAERIGEIFSKKISGIPSDRPIYAIGKVSEHGSPLTVITPEKKTELKRVTTLGFVYIFTNQPQAEETKAIAEIKKDSPFFKTAEYKGVVAPDDSIKTMEILITPELLEKTAAERARHHGRRKISQNKIAGWSATKYVHATEEAPKNSLWEWLHLIAHSILGDKAQTIKNLVAGSHASNTKMLFVECEIKTLSKQFPEGFTLEVAAEMVPETQIAKTIRYTIKNKDFMMPFVFPAQDFMRPHIVHRDYIHLLVQAFIESSLEKITADFAPAPDSLFNPLKAKSRRLVESFSSMPKPLY